jgi:hypothetical protein
MSTSLLNNQFQVGLTTIQFGLQTHSITNQYIDLRLRMPLPPTHMSTPQPWESSQQEQQKLRVGHTK